MGRPTSTVFFIYFSVTGLVMSARIRNAKGLCFNYNSCYNEITKNIICTHSQENKDGLKSQLRGSVRQICTKLWNTCNESNVITHFTRLTTGPLIIVLNLHDTRFHTYFTLTNEHVMFYISVSRKHLKIYHDVI